MAGRLSSALSHFLIGFSFRMSCRGKPELGDGESRDLLFLALERTTGNPAPLEIASNVSIDQEHLGGNTAFDSAVTRYRATLISPAKSTVAA